ncbi:MAG: FHA domain-containing protein [Deltaproteobacteria bacterium]|nr:FHA domain-containing protein [Deltaproteobacteria bacterium]
MSDARENAGRSVSGLAIRGGRSGEQRAERGAGGGGQAVGAGQEGEARAVFELAICDGSLAGARWIRTVSAGTIVVGRAAASDLALPDPSVSLRHLRVCAGPSAGEWTIEDLGSRRGSRLNGQRLQPGRAVPLRSGDQVELGVFRLRFHGDRAPSKASARSAARELASRLESATPRTARVLHIAHRTGREERVALAPGKKLRIGRGRDCDVILGDPRASRHHALVECRPDGAVAIRDTGSTNGFKLNGRRQRGSVRLRPQDRLEIGDCLLQLELRAGAAREPASGGWTRLLAVPLAGGTGAAFPWPVMLLGLAAALASLAVWGV